VASVSLFPRKGRLAQLVEHCAHTAGVTGSSPVAPTCFGPPALGLKARVYFVMMRRPSKVISRKADTVRIIKITGRLDPGEGPDQLFEMVEGFLEEAEIDFLIDLRSVTYISSTGVGSLIKSYRSVLKKKGHLKLLSPSQSVRNILAISKLDGVFEILSSLSL
jgi:anti-anti-sigma factor